MKESFRQMGFILLGTDPDKNHFNAGEYLGCCIFLPLVLGEIICNLCSTLQRGRSCITNWKSSHKGLVTKKVKLIEKNAVIAHNKIAAFVVCCKQLTINIDLNPRSFKIDWRNAMASSQSSWNVMIRQWTWLKLDAMFSILLLKPYICSRHVSLIWLVAGLQPKLFLSKWYMFTFSF